jgi:hypothetical protein
MIDKYIRRVESKLSECLWLVKMSIEKISNEMVIMRGQLVFLDDSILKYDEPKGDD